MSVLVGAKSNADVYGLPPDKIIEPAEVLAHKSHQARVNQILISVICAVACAIFAALAVLAFIALSQIGVPIALFTAPAFLALSLGMIGMIGAIGMAVLSVKQSIDAHHNRLKAISG